MTHVTKRPGLTADERRAFDTKGLVKLPAAVAPRAVAEMADRLWAELERKDGVRREDRTTWRVERTYGFQALQASGAFRGMGSAPVRAALDELMGEGRWEEPATWGLPLVCFPSAGDGWAVPRQGWHFDGPIDSAPRRALMGRVFLILEPLEPRGGGTLVAAGSHRVAMALADAAGAQQSSADMRKRLAREHPWFDDLMHSDGGEARTARFMDRETMVAGVPLQVAEMTGEPGDVWLMHPNALHSGAPNRRQGPRLVLTQFVAPRA